MAAHARQKPAGSCPRHVYTKMRAAASPMQRCCVPGVLCKRARFRPRKLASAPQPCAYLSIIWHKIKTKRSHTRYTPPLDSVFCALYFGVSLFTQLFVSFWESWCQVFCYFFQTSLPICEWPGVQAEVCLCSAVLSFPCLRACQHDNFERKCPSH